MVGIGENLFYHLQCRIEIHELFFQKNAQQLGNGHGGMGVVELHHIGFGEVGEVRSVLLPVPPDNALQGSAGEEVFLLQPELSSLVGVVVGIQAGGNGLCFLPVLHGLAVFLLVKQGKVKAVYRLGLPEAQGVDSFPAVADDGHIVGHGPHILAGKMHFHPLICPAQTPGVAELLPIVGVFPLEAPLDGLAEQAILIPDAKAVQGDVLGGGGIQKAGSQTPQAAVAQGRVVHLVKELRGAAVFL